MLWWKVFNFGKLVRFEKLLFFMEIHYLLLFFLFMIYDLLFISKKEFIFSRKLVRFGNLLLFIIITDYYYYYLLLLFLGVGFIFFCLEMFTRLCQDWTQRFLLVGRNPAFCSIHG